MIHARQFPARLGRLLMLLGALSIGACGGGGGSSGGSTVVATPAKILVVGALGSAATQSDITSKLTAFGVFDSVDYFDASAGTPSLAALQAYDAVLVTSGIAFSNAASLGNVIADYIDAGGAVVVSMFAMVPGADLAGRFHSGSYRCIGLAPSATSTDVNSGISKVNATHPIVADVNSINGGSPCYAPPGATLLTGAALIATWDDAGQTPLVATKLISGVRRVDLGLFPVTSDSQAAGGTGRLDPATDAMRLVANALRWASKRL